MREKMKITITEILSGLDEGMTRQDFKEKYNLTTKELKVLFNHSKLKNKKTRKPISFELVDDTDETRIEEKVENAPEAKVEEKVLLSTNDESNSTDNGELNSEPTPVSLFD
jgi:hypothetical protein